MTKSGFVPHHMIADILSRLPVNSLLRFKIACKSWYSLISDPDFANLHSKFAPQGPKILFTTERARFRLLDTENSIFDDSCLPAPFDFPPKTQNFVYYTGYPNILGSGGGLVCVDLSYVLCVPIHYWRHDLFLWNPFTRESRKIPDLTPPIRDFIHAYGFGYDSVSNDFKLVVFKSETCNVFSMKSNSWKFFTCPPNLTSIGRFERQATVVDGVFHWLQSSYLGFGFEVVAFDATEYKFSNLPIPSYSHLTKACLLEHNGCLCISFQTYIPEEVLALWMLKEHAWNHFFTISSEYVSRFKGPICIYSSSSSCEFILHDTNRILRYSKEKEKLGEIITRSWKILKANVCVETLISPSHNVDLH